MDARIWKTDIATSADRIIALSQFSRYSERRADEFEREVIMAFFRVRTLLERHMFSDDFLSRRIDVTTYRKKTEKPTTWLNNHKIEELFDLESPKSRQIDLNFICNQIIHSTIFIPVRNGQCFSHLLLCSDFERNHSLFLVELDVIVELLTSASTDWHNATSCEFNQKKRDFDVKNEKLPNPTTAPRSMLTGRGVTQRSRKETK